MTTPFRSLSELEFEQVALPALRAVFRSEDPFDRPVSPEVEERALLFPVQYELEATMLSALAKAASDLRDDAFILSILERPPASAQDHPYHWIIPFTELHRYRELSDPFVLENALYSPSGQWGLMVSHEQHAIVAGPSGFTRAISQVMPESLDAQAAEFLGVWRDNKSRLGSDVSWIPSLLANVYGEDRTRALLGTEQDWLNGS